MAKGESKKKSPPTRKSDGSMAAESVDDGFRKKEMVLLQSEDGKKFLMSMMEAINCGTTVFVMINYDYESCTIPSDDGGGEIKCRLVRLSVQGDILSKVVVFSKCLMPSEAACFLNIIQDNATRFDLILAADYLRNQSLLDFICEDVADRIKGMSPDVIRKIFNIRSYWAQNNKNMSSVKPDLDENRMLTLEQNALKALHVVHCQKFTKYDPKRKDFICTRFCNYNIAFFDFDKESRLARGPPLDKLTGPISRSSVQSALNVISLKVTKSHVGKKLRVFGTVVARDQVDYKCLYLFNRGQANAQTITLPDGMLTLEDPYRGLVLSDEIVFEINLMVTDQDYCADFSIGVISFERARLPSDQQTMTLGLNSFLSRVELTCAHVVHPVEATIAINILKGLCNLSKVAAWTTGNPEDCLSLYDSEADGTQKLTGNGTQTLTRNGSEADATQTLTRNGHGSVRLSRCVVAVPLDTKLVVHLVGDDNVQHDVTLGQSDDQSVFKMGSCEMQVKVGWTCIMKRESYKLEVIGDECLLH